MSGMGQSPKVIQVSFGAFSCTLEGFEDPVETLFAVTEHFRALAASDPGFARGTSVPDRAALERAIAGAGTLRVRWAEGPELRVELSPGAREPGAGDRAPQDGRPEPAGREGGRSVLERLEDALWALPRTLAAGPFGQGRGEGPPREAAEAAPQDGGERLAGEPGGPPLQRTEGQASDWAEDDAHWPGDGEDWPEEDREEAWPPDGSMPPVPEGAPAEPAEARKLLEVSPDQDEATLQRFLSRTEEQLADPGTAQRREAMAHLKAAVAATRAQRIWDGEQPDPEGLGAFRQEWAATARPRGWMERALPRPAGQPRAELQRTAFPEAGRRPGGLAEPPGPKFEPEGRPAAQPGATADGPLDRDAAHSFPGFAEAAGAVGLPDLLEAAATWVSVVRGEEAVSRAQLLRLAAEALPEPPRREDALRVFGTLLRQGRLARVERGRFRLGESTRFVSDRQTI